MEQLSILDPQSTEKSISNLVFISFSLKLKPPSPRSAYLYTYSNHLIIGFFMRLMNCVESSKFSRRVPSSGHTVYSPFVCSFLLLYIPWKGRYIRENTYIGKDKRETYNWCKVFRPERWLSFFLIVND